MTGSLQVKNGKYYMVLNSTENGKRKQKWISTGLPEKGNKRKAEQMLREKLTEEEKRNPVVCSDMTVADCVRRWLTRMRRRVDEVTYRSYQHTAETHILPYFDENRLKLCDCTVEVLQTYFDEKYRNGRKDGKGGLSSKTMRHHKGILGQALAECVKDGLIPSNPCQYVEMPRRERHEAHFYSAEQLQQLITALNGDPIQPLVKIAALYGLRRSELLGLKWDSIDFENGMVLIRHTVCKMIVTVEKDKTKTQSSRRSFPMTEEAREIFLKAKAEEEENQRLFGKAYQKNDYVFKWPDGRTFAPDYVTHHFSKMLERYGMPHIRFHELRHPYVKHTTKIFSLRLMDFQAQAYPDARQKTRGACQLLRVGQSRSPVRPLCNRKRFSCLPPQSKMSWILYAISMRLSGYTSTRSISSSASSVVSVSASKIALDASLRLSCRACSSCFCFACANTAA